MRYGILACTLVGGLAESAGSLDYADTVATDRDTFDTAGLFTLQEPAAGLYPGVVILLGMALVALGLSLRRKRS